MEIIKSHWHQIVFIIGLIVVAVKLSAQVKEIQKDLDHLQSSLDKRDTYVDTVKHRAEVNNLQSQVGTPWDYNKLRDKFNGH